MPDADPPDRGELAHLPDRGELAHLAHQLTDPDPDLRDGVALPGIAEAIMAGLDSSDRQWLGSLMCDFLRHPEIQARASAALVLAILATTGPFDPAWVGAMRSWYVTEADLRGFDPELGWLHAVANGADAIGAIGRAGHAPPGMLLATLARRLVTPTEYVWSEQEDDRVAYAVALVLSSPALDAIGATAWLGPVAALIAEPQQPPGRPERINAIHTLRSLRIALDGQVVAPDGRLVEVPEVDAVRSALVAALAPATPWFWRTGGEA